MKYYIQHAAKLNRRTRWLGVEEVDCSSDREALEYLARQIRHSSRMDDRETYRVVDENGRVVILFSPGPMSRTRNAT